MEAEMAAQRTQTNIMEKLKVLRREDALLDGVNKHRKHTDERDEMEKMLDKLETATINSAGDFKDGVEEN